MSKKGLNLFLLTAASLSASLLITAVVYFLIPIEQLSKFQLIVDIVRFLGGLVATSLFGKRIQLTGMWLMTVAVGFRYPYQGYLIATGTGVSPSPLFICGAGIIWLLWLIWKGKRLPIDSDEWKITFSTIVQIIIAGLIVGLVFGR